MRVLRRSNQELFICLPIGLVAVGLLAFCPTATAQQRSLTTAAGGESTYDPMQEYVNAQRAHFNAIYDSIPPEQRREWTERTGSPLRPPGPPTADASTSEQIQDLVDFQQRLYDNIYNSITPEMRKEWEEQVGTPLVPPRYPVRSESTPRPANPGDGADQHYIRPLVGFGEDAQNAGAKLLVEGLITVMLPEAAALRVGLAFAGFECAAGVLDAVPIVFLDGLTKEGERKIAAPVFEEVFEGIAERVITEVGKGAPSLPLRTVAFIGGKIAGGTFSSTVVDNSIKRPLLLVGVPSVRGLPLPYANRLLLEANLRCTHQWVKTNKERQHLKVYDQDPSAGRAIFEREHVLLTVFFHPGPKGKYRTVPQVTGLRHLDAEALICMEGFKPDGVGTNEGVPPGTRVREVFSQDPLPGVRHNLVEGTVGYLYYAGIKVPDYRTMRKEVAELEIRFLGLKPQTDTGDRNPPSEVDRGTVYEQSPAAGDFVAKGDTIRIVVYKEGEGFRDGDGEQVDLRFKSAKVTDGQAPGMEGPSAGKRTAIVYSRGGGGGEKSRSGVDWQIRKYTDAAGARAFLAKQVKDGFFSAKGVSTPQAKLTVKPADIRGDRAIGTIEIVSQEGHLTSHVSIFIHRERFVILFTSVVPEAGHDFANESKRIIENSQALINTRFPSD